MNFNYAPCGLEIFLESGKISGLNIENINVWKGIVESLWEQSNGNSGNIYIMDKDNEIKVDKDVSIVFNPFSLDVNEKKVISKLYTEMKNISEQELYVHKTDINTSIVKMLDEINECLSYPIEFSLDLDIQQLFKIYGVKINMQDSTLIEKITNYMKLTHQILGTKLFVFVHLQQYLNDEEWSYFKELVAYEQISVLLLENGISREKSNENWWIVDADNCIIAI